MFRFNHHHQGVKISRCVWFGGVAAYAQQSFFKRILKFTLKHYCNNYNFRKLK